MKAGLYQHFKGDFYFVIGTAKHTETNEELVVYVASTGAHGPRPDVGSLYVRPLDMFQEEVNGVPRFKLIHEGRWRTTP